jgi:hypothetical protein
VEEKVKAIVNNFIVSPSMISIFFRSFARVRGLPDRGGYTKWLCLEGVPRKKRESISWRSAECIGNMWLEILQIFLSTTVALQLCSLHLL